MDVEKEERGMGLGLQAWGLMNGEEVGTDEVEWLSMRGVLGASVGYSSRRAESHDLRTEYEEQFLQ